MNNDKNFYRDFCLKEDSIPLFLTFQWMNAVAKPDEWEVLLDKSGDVVNGVWVYSKKKKLKMIKLSSPVLTPYSGLWYFYPQGKSNTGRIRFEKEVTERLLKSIPPYDFFTQTLHHEITNWLPLYWNGFSQTTRYTYILNTKNDNVKLFSEFRNNIKRDIRRAEKSLKIENCSAEELFRLKKIQHKSLQDKLPYSFEYLNRIISTAISENFGATYKAVDINGQTNAAIFFVWDKNYMYYLVGATHPDHKTSGAMSLLLWHGIQMAIENGIPKFDFEGSMIEGVENFFRGFGGDLVPYHQITKYNKPLLKWIKSVRK